MTRWVRSSASIVGTAAVLMASLVAVSLLVAVSSCAVGRQMLAPADELDVYRRARTAGSIEDRLHYGSEYLHAHPKGVFSEEISAWMSELEPRYLEEHWTTVPRLRRYLEVMPHGPHAEQVRRRLERLLGEANAMRTTDESRDVAAEQRLTRLSQAAGERRQALDALVASLARLFEVRSFGQPIDALPERFRADFATTDVACHARGCFRQWVMPYAVPGDGGLIERELRWTVGYEAAGGVLERVFVTGYSLFDRISEVATVHAVASGDASGRDSAIAAATTIISNSVESTLPAARCSRTPVAPVVLQRDCDGATLWVVAGPNPETPDFVELRAPGAPDTAAVQPSDE